MAPFNRSRRQLAAGSLVVSLLVASGADIAAAGSDKKKNKSKHEVAMQPADDVVSTTTESADAVVVAESTVTTIAPESDGKKSRGGKTDAPTIDCATPEHYSEQGTTGSLKNVRKAIGLDVNRYARFDGAGVDVALIDTGVAPVPGLDKRNQVVHGPDLSLEAAVPELRNIDAYGHGTHMAGIIAGRGEVTGVAPGARIVSVKVGDNTGAVDVSQVIAAIDWVIEHRTANGLNIRVLNLSYGVTAAQSYEVDPLARAVERAWESGIVVVVAAGNDGRAAEELANPAYDPHVIAVAALHDAKSQWVKNHDIDLNCTDGDPRWKLNKAVTSDTATARQPDVFAPGTSIISLRTPGSRVDATHPSARVNDALTKGTGTSQAAAVVSGAVAVLLDARPELTPDQVKALIRSTVDDGGDVEDDIIDVAAAIQAPTPADADQSHPHSTGKGPIELSRGGDHLTDKDGRKLIGEASVHAGAWDSADWAGRGWTGSSWTGSSWTGSSWTSGTWLGSSWTGSSWTGSSWTGSSWTGSSWTGRSWTGSSWTGSSWTGSSWTGSSWTGSSWTGSSWTGSSWG